MKRFFTGASLLLLTVILFGCEGHVKTLYLKDNKEIKTPWLSTTILIKSNKNVYTEIETIAEKLSLNKNPKQKNVYYLDNFFMYVNKKGIQKGAPNSGVLWEIGLKDWPDTSRSELSKKVEKAIREKLEKK
ncbi:MAG: hypothetical protein KOO69_03170 [Victivallales bacterium]|nr:hypothetical protein [Victivallales bacterium]